MIRPLVSIPQARALLSVRYASTTGSSGQANLSALYGKGSSLRAQKQKQDQSKSRSSAATAGSADASSAPVTISNSEPSSSSSSPSFSFQSRNDDRLDDFDASIGGMSEESFNSANAGSRAIPLFKYHGNWGVPKTPGVRHLKMPFSPWLWPGKPFKALTSPVRKNGGRGEFGRIVRRHIGGGHKRRHRLIDFMRLESGPQDVVRIEYDPGRSAHICLLRNRTGLGPHGGWSYVLAPDGIRAGDVLTSYRSGIPRGLVPQWDEECDARTKEEVEERGKKWIIKQEARHLLEFGVPLEPKSLIEGPEVVNLETSATENLVTLSQTSSTPKPLSSGLSQRSFSSTSAPAIQESQISEPIKTKAPSILPPKFNPTYTQSTTFGTNPSFALNLLRTLVVKPGNVLQLALIPAGTAIHNITLRADSKMALCRSAGTTGSILSHQKADDKGKIYSFVKLQSGEVRMIPSNAFATIGQISNKYHGQRNLGKAGRRRWLGRRPRVRGVAMNACDHPHGGGRGKSKSNTHPKSIYGWLTRGIRTRKPGVNGHKNGNKMVVKERPRGKQTPALMQRK
ncbi:ribosomal protein l2 [Phaffia rhodozyma]|uniref:Ribosomal protein l2 n=1 Tax=Phaffia rhodozyma TaxID=264483 RepID=A0A0F7SVE6_PHARH|nr:ribosomal protein l2 [Phaffia rhodozyma]